MAIDELNSSPPHGSNPEEEIEEDEDDDEEDWVGDDDSDEDLTFDAVEKTRSELSKLSLKKSKPRSSKEGDLVNDELDEKEEICFASVERLVKDGQLEKLNVARCKVYLRKYALRLAGNKDILIGRIKEHLEIMDGNGEKKYPPSSFVLNCKGDACMGDVVMFEQRVYEMYNVASRSATGPPCGTRVIAGRIVKESYGSAKQQHTFTIEVLWSKGEKPLPSLHPLLIKGRNLYRLQTMRQRWPDEGQRVKILQEKHLRGSVARCARDNRIQEKEKRKIGKIKSTLKKTNSNHTLVQEGKKKATTSSVSITGQQSNLHQQQNLQHKHQGTGLEQIQISSKHPAINVYGSNIPQSPSLLTDYQRIWLQQQILPKLHEQTTGEFGKSTTVQQTNQTNTQSFSHQQQHFQIKSGNPITVRHGDGILPTPNFQPVHKSLHVLQPSVYHNRVPFQSDSQANRQQEHQKPRQNAHKFHVGRPTSNCNSPPRSPRRHHSSSFARPSSPPWCPLRKHHRQQPLSRSNLPTWNSSQYHGQPSFLHGVQEAGSEWCNRDSHLGSLAKGSVGMHNYYY